VDHPADGRQSPVATNETNNPNTSFFTLGTPAPGTFTSKNVWCAGTAACGKDVTIYGTFYDTCTKTTFTDTVIIHVNPCPGTVLGPTIECVLLNTTVNAETGQCGAHVTLGMPLVGGGVPPLTTVCKAPIGPGGSLVDVSSGTFFPAGTTQVTCTVTDATRLTASCQFTVTVVPPAPTITCPGNITTDCTGTTTFAAAANSVCTNTPTIIYWIGSPILAQGTVITSPRTFPVGTTTVYAQAADAFNKSTTCSFNVTRPICAASSGRMTGGGSIFTSDGRRVTHGFELHCDLSTPNNLEINWKDTSGNEHKFHLTLLTSAVCSDDPAIAPNPPNAGFDTFVGQGIGLLDGTAGATISFILTDAGEPGVNDFALYLIKNPQGSTVLSASGFLDKGNQQAHKN